MTKFTLSALALVCVLMLAGCSTASRPGNCGCIEGNLCGWNFYKPADLVEGQAVHCRDLCCPQPPQCCPGVQYTQTTVPAPEPMPAPASDALPAPEVMEAAPAAEAAGG